MIGEYDAGYEHCIDSMVKQMEDMQYRIDCLHRDNAKLRERIDSAHMSRLLTENENESLRELVQRMWRLERFGCHECRRECDAESCYASDCKEAIEIEQEMRELGIEVPR